MAPVNITLCILQLSKIKLVNASSQYLNSSTNSSLTKPEPEKSEIQALLYIVITLLFYSLGIIVGIISYLKREKREMEEDRIYDQYIASRQDPVWSPKYEKVQQVISRLQTLENEKLARLAAEREDAKLLSNDHLQLDHSDNENVDSEKSKSKRSSHLKPHFSVKIKDSSEKKLKTDSCSPNSIKKFQNCDSPSKGNASDVPTQLHDITVT